jgi:hypothetical protein
MIYEYASLPSSPVQDFDAIYDVYKSQLNVEGVGAVVAAPDFDTPGG